MLSVAMPSVAMLSVAMLSVAMLIVIKLNADMLSVGAPFRKFTHPQKKLIQEGKLIERGYL
jgi:hypothetical protein